MFGSTNWSSFFTKLAHSWSLGIAMGPTRSSSIAVHAASANQIDQSNPAGGRLRRPDDQSFLPSRFMMPAYALYDFWISPTTMDSSSRPEFSRFRYAYISNQHLGQGPHAGCAHLVQVVLLVELPLKLPVDSQA